MRRDRQQFHSDNRSFRRDNSTMSSDSPCLVVQDQQISSDDGFGKRQDGISDVLIAVEQTRIHKSLGDQGSSERSTSPISFVKFYYSLDLTELASIKVNVGKRKSLFA
jgi:hypothetical protein